MLTIGQPVPDFTLPDQDGQPLSLSGLRGQKVIIFAFPKADTPGCTTQACGFRDALPRLQTQKAVVLGVSPDEPAALKKWATKQNLTYRLLSDPQAEMLSAWGAWGEKSMYGKTYMGVTRSHWVLDENGILLDAQYKVKPEDSVKKALAILGG
jgi:peroxiredoxin Q/BCP